MERTMKGTGVAILLAALAALCGGCGGGGGGGSSATAEALQPLKVYCPGSLAECVPDSVGAEIYVGYRVGGAAGTCPELVVQGGPAFDAFGSVPVDQPWDSGVFGVVSQFSGGGAPVTHLTVAPDTPILCCAVIDTQGAVGPDSGDPYAEADCWPFHAVLDQNNLLVEQTLP